MSKGPVLPTARRFGLVALVCVAVLGLAGCRASDDEQTRVVLGVGSTHEQEVLAALTVEALERAEIDVEVRADLGDTVGLRRQARLGSIDLYWDYTGAAWALGHGQQTPPASPRESFERVREEDAPLGLVWLERTEVNATLAFFVREEDVPAAEHADMDWLAGVLSAEEETLCVDEDFRYRPGGLQELATEYYLMDLSRVRVVSADADEAIEGVAEGRCFAGLGVATSGEAHNAGLVPVVDELGVFPAFVVAAVVREEALEAVPELDDALAPLVESFDTATLAALNGAAVEADPAELAAQFLDGVAGGTQER